jgi:hypothetical protein
MKIMMKRSISLLLALVMVAAMLPAFGTLKAHAAEDPLMGWIDKAYCPEPGKLFVEGWALHRVENDDKSYTVDTVNVHIYIGGPSGGNGYGIDLGKTNFYRWLV